MKRGIKNLGLTFLVVLVVLPAVIANSLTVSAPVSVNPGQTFSVDIIGSTTTSDLHSIQFDFNYDDSVLLFNSISEGAFLSESGTVVTIFNYTGLSSDKIDNIYNARNTTWQDPSPGVTGTNQVIATINFFALSTGSSNLGLTNVIWVNSSILNNSAAIINPTITNDSINVIALPCNLINANWSATSVVEGTLVTLTVEGDSNCVGEQINFTVIEDDGVLADPVLALGGLDHGEADASHGRVRVVEAELECQSALLDGSPLQGQLHYAGHKNHGRGHENLSPGAA